MYFDFGLAKINYNYMFKVLCEPKFIFCYRNVEFLSPLYIARCSEKKTPPLMTKSNQNQQAATCEGIDWEEEAEDPPHMLSKMSSQKSSQKFL